jgi:hypothetical protein
MVKTLKISDNTHKELTILSAKLTAKDGKRRTFDEAIMEIIIKYENR